MTVPTTMGPEMDERIDDMTVQEVADLLHVTPGTVRRWIKAGAFPTAWRPPTTPRGVWRIPRESVVAWQNLGH